MNMVRIQAECCVWIIVALGVQSMTIVGLKKRSRIDCPDIVLYLSI